MTSSNTIATDLTFEEVRQSFLLRLRSDAEHLGVLANSLECTERDTEAVFGNLAEFAHRLRGAAAVFEARELSADAKSLELAVAAAANVQGRCDDRLVLAALHTLAARLASINGSPLHD